MSDKFIYSTIPSAEYATAERCHIIEILNLPSVPEASLAQARVEPGVCTANHLLKSTAEWYYILSGSGDVYIDNQLAGTVSAGDT
ncbi:MAG: cupin domain-containing protein, partial [Bacteroidota bacterium]